MEIEPCDKTTLEQLLRSWDWSKRQVTTVRLHFGTFELLGKFNAFNIFIYEMSEPSDVLAVLGQSLPVSIIAYLGIRYDGGKSLSDSLDWLEFLSKFQRLDHLNIDGTLAALDSLIIMEETYHNVPMDLSHVTLTISKSNMEGLNNKQLQNEILRFTSTFRKVLLKLKVFAENELSLDSCDLVRSQGADKTKNFLYECAWVERIMRSNKRILPQEILLQRNK